MRQERFRRLNLIRRLGGTKWGWRRTQLRPVYLALIRSVAEYAAPAWFPWTAKTNVEQLETAQLAVARAITNLLGRTPKEVVRHEANLQPLAVRLRELTLLHADKSSQLKPNDPRREMMNQRVATRLRRTGWREMVLPELARLGLDAPSS